MVFEVLSADCSSPSELALRFVHSIPHSQRQDAASDKGKQAILARGMQHVDEELRLCLLRLAVGPGGTITPALTVGKTSTAWEEAGTRLCAELSRLLEKTHRVSEAGSHMTSHLSTAVTLFMPTAADCAGNGSGRSQPKLGA